MCKIYLHILSIQGWNLPSNNIVVKSMRLCSLCTHVHHIGIRVVDGVNIAEFGGLEGLNVE